MKILIDAKLLGKGGTTGVSGYTKEMVSALFKYTPHEYRLFYNGFNMNPLPEEWLADSKVSVVNLHVPNKLLHITNRLFNFPKVEKFTGSRVGARDDIRPDVIFSPHFHLLPSGRIPRIITFHDISFIHYPQFFSPKQRIWHWWQNYASQARRAKRIIAVSEYTKADLVNILKIPAEKITVIHSGIGPEFKKISSNDPKLTNYRLTNQLTRPFFLFMGTLEPRKNIPTLIKAFTLLKQDPKFKEYELVIAGRPGYGAEEIFKTARHSSASADIRFIGSPADQERPLLYSQARAFVFPSWFEGFGFPPLEAQACGTPVVASDRTSLPEILGDSAIYFDPWKTAQMAEQMARVATDTMLRKTLISKGLENVKRFTWHGAAAALNKVFESTV